MSLDKGEDFLQHYGKKGMKWGRRKDRKNSSQRNYQTSKLSNSELKAVINRMQLEQQYNDLNIRGESGKKKFVRDVTTEAGKKVAGRILANAMLGGVKYGAIKTSKSLPRISKALAYVIKK